MKKVLLSISLLFNVLLILSLTFPSSNQDIAKFQLPGDDGNRILQDGKEVGEIYVPPRDLDDKVYIEYWYLGEKYVYPDRENKKEVTIKPKEKRPRRRSKKEFKKEMERKFKKGKLVTVYCIEEN